MGLACIGTWAAVISFIYFAVMYVLNFLRIDIGTETVGYDFMDFSEIDFRKKRLVISKEGSSMLPQESDRKPRQKIEKEDLPPIINPRD